MAISLLFKVTKTKLGSLELDASLSEQHTASVEATDHAVERGSNIVDHARPKPEQVAITGIVSNTPVDSAVLRALGGEAPKGGVGRAEEALATLYRLKNQSTVLTVVTPIRTYENMLLTELSIPRDVSTGDALHFTATLKQIRIVETKLSTVTTATPAAQKKKNMGRKAGTPTDESTQSKSLLKKAKDSGAGHTFLKALGL